MRLLKLFFITLLTLSISIFTVACGDYEISVPTTMDSAISKLENAGYEITVAVALPEGVTEALTAYKSSSDSYEGVIVLWFATGEEAEEYSKGWNDSRYQVKKIFGNMAYYGTEGAIKDFEKA